MFRTYRMYYCGHVCYLTGSGSASRIMIPILNTSAQLWEGRTEMQWQIETDHYRSSVFFFPFLNFSTWCRVLACMYVSLYWIMRYVTFALCYTFL